MVRRASRRRSSSASGSASISRSRSDATPTARATRCRSGATSCAARRGCASPHEFEDPAGLQGRAALPHLLPQAGRGLSRLHRVLQGGGRRAVTAVPDAPGQRQAARPARGRGFPVRAGEADSEGDIQVVAPAQLPASGFQLNTPQSFECISRISASVPALQATARKHGGGWSGGNSGGRSDFSSMWKPDQPWLEAGSCELEAGSWKLLTQTWFN